MHGRTPHGHRHRSAGTRPGAGWRGRGSAGGLTDPIEVQFSRDDGDGVGRLGDHRPPWIDDHRATEGGLARWPADLRRRQHVGAVLDGPGPQQHLPVVAPGPLREVGRDGQDLAPRPARARGTAPGTAGRSRSTGRPGRRRRRRSTRPSPAVTRADSVSTGPASTATSKRWILRYAAAMAPSGPMSTRRVVRACRVVATSPPAADQDPGVASPGDLGERRPCVDRGSAGPRRGTRRPGPGTGGTRAGRRAGRPRRRPRRRARRRVAMLAATSPVASSWTRATGRRMTAWYGDRDDHGVG